MSANTPDDITVVDNPAASRYEARIGDQLAVAEYRREGDSIIFTHTEVPEALEGRGIAGRLAQVALEAAREGELAVIPLCPYFASYIRRHQEYAALVPPEYAASVARGRERS